VDQLVGDATKARTVLGWRPQYTFEDLIKEMVQSDVALMARTTASRGGGEKTRGRGHEDAERETT
jgi:GDPmannose 4,6-dehydratase